MPFGIAASKSEKVRDRKRITFHQLRVVVQRVNKAANTRETLLVNIAQSS